MPHACLWPASKALWAPKPLPLEKLTLDLTPLPALLSRPRVPEAVSHHFFGSSAWRKAPFAPRPGLRPSLRIHAALRHAPRTAPQHLQRPPSPLSRATDQLIHRGSQRSS